MKEYIAQKKKYCRLTESERKSVEQGLKAGMSIKALAASIGRSTSTLSREITRNSNHVQTGGYGTAFNNCVHRETCIEEHICSKEDCRRSYCCGCKFCFHVCKKYEREHCPKLDVSPYVCNGCKRRRLCTLEKAVYEAKTAGRSADDVLHNSRSGIDLTEAERRRLDGIISPLIERKQSPNHIWMTHGDELMISTKTIYNYIAKGLFSAKSTDLMKKVKMKQRKTKKQGKIERRCRDGRAYEDFLAFTKSNNAVGVVEIDSVIGKIGGSQKVLLTMQFTGLRFMLAFIREANTAKSVRECIDKLYEKLGAKVFTEMFGVLLTDNGSEFSNPSAIETGGDGVLRTRVFYCDPYSSFQKPHVENNHDFIRRFLPKGTSMNPITQRDVNLMMSHINSYARRSLSGLTPAELFIRAYGKETMETLGLKTIKADEITLSPTIFK